MPSRLVSFLWRASVVVLLCAGVVLSQPAPARGNEFLSAASVQQAHEALMASPLHKANVLRADFRRVGIAIVPGGRWPVLVVEVLASDP